MTTRRSISVGLAAALLSTTLAASLCAADGSPDTLRTFYFGNSLTGCTQPKWHEQLGASAGKKWVATASLGAGWHLWQHRSELSQSGIPLDRGSRGDLTIDPDQIANARYRVKQFLTGKWDAIVLQPFGLGLRFTTDKMYGKKLDKTTDVGDIASSIGIIDTFLAVNPKGTVYIYQNWPKMESGKVPPDDQLPKWAAAMKAKRGSIRTAEFPDRDGFDYEKAWLGPKYKDSPDPTKFWLREGARSRDFHHKLFEALKAHYPELWKAGRLQAIPVGDMFLAIDKAAQQGKVPGLTSIKDFYTDVQHTRAGLARYTAAAAFYAALFRAHPRSLDWKLYNDASKYGSDPHHDSGELLPITSANAEAVHNVIWQVLREHEQVNWKRD